MRGALYDPEVTDAPLQGLIALDLDGTLLRPDGTIDPRDAAAVRHAIEAGWAVTLATGRLAHGTVPAARALGLSTPLICADGGAIVDARSGEALALDPLQAGAIAHVLAALEASSVAGFAFTLDTIHCDPVGHPHSLWLRGWSPELRLHPRLADAPCCAAGEVLFAVGLGAAGAVGAAYDALAAASDRVPLAVARYALGDESTWALRIAPGATTKASGLARLAQELGLDATRVVAVGDWWNDVPAFEWAGRSFAMGQAPAAVKLAATDVLEATCEEGGGIAEAVRLLIEV